MLADVDQPLPPTVRTCALPECDEPARPHAKYCSDRHRTRHWQRQRIQSLPKHPCPCGCGQLTSFGFKAGHQLRQFSPATRTAWARAGVRKTLALRDAAGWARSDRERARAPEHAAKLREAVLRPEVQLGKRLGQIWRAEFPPPAPPLRALTGGTPRRKRQGGRPRSDWLPKDPYLLLALIHHVEELAAAGGTQAKIGQLKGWQLRPSQVPSKADYYSCQMVEWLLRLARSSRLGYLLEAAAVARDAWDRPDAAREWRNPTG